MLQLLLLLVLTRKLVKQRTREYYHKWWGLLPEKTPPTTPKWIQSGQSRPVHLGFLMIKTKDSEAPSALETITSSPSKTPGKLKDHKDSNVHPIVTDQVLIDANDNANAKMDEDIRPKRGPGGSTVFISSNGNATNQDTGVQIKATTKQAPPPATEVNMQLQATIEPLNH